MYRSATPTAKVTQLDYNLILGLSRGRQFDDIKPITEEEKAILLKGLKEAPKIASDITLRHMARPTSKKTYEFSKK